MADALPPTGDREFLLRLLPSVRRARGYRLYDLHGKRYLDLYLSGGRALLGYRPDRVILELKNLISRGLMSELPSVFEHRLSRALASILPDYPLVRVFATEERLIEAFSEFASPPVTISDPAVADASRDASSEPLIERWRPFLPQSPAPHDGPRVLVPSLPFPASFAPAVACIRGVPEARLPHSDIVAPALLGALLRSVFELRRFAERYREERWSRFEAPWWIRRGPYLIARCTRGEYSELFRRLLERGILINPDFPGPSIVPAEYTEGELKPLRTMADEWSAAGGIPG